MKRIPKTNVNMRHALSWIRGLILGGGVLLLAMPTQAGKIFFIHADPPDSIREIDQAVIDRMIAAGHEVTLRTVASSADRPDPSEADGHDLIYIRESIGSGNVGDTFKNSLIPVLTDEQYLADDMGFAPKTEGVAQGADQIPYTEIEILDPTHPLAAGLSGVVKVYEEPNNMGRALDLADGAIRVGSVVGEPDRVTMYVIPAGATMHNGFVVPGHRVGLFHFGNVGVLYTEEAWQILEAGIDWALGTPPPPSRILNFSPSKGSSFVPVDSGITFTASADVEILTENITLTLNGVDVTSDLVLTGGPNSWQGAYNKTLNVNTVYKVEILVTNENGERTTKTSFDTISSGNLTIEAEDFNFAAGAFFNDPIVCDIGGGGVDRCYMDRVSRPGIDANDSVDDDRPTESDADYLVFLDNGYRFGPGVFRDELVDTWVSGDSLRDKFTAAGEGVLDHDVERISTGEWMNYTRTFEPGTYQILARVRGRGDQSLSLGLVDTPTSVSQTVSPLGTFNISSTSGSYRFVSLNDDQGRTAIVELSGRQTLRLTAVDADEKVNINFFMFIPAEVVSTPTAVNLQVALEGGEIKISWDGNGGILQRAAAVTGPWENLAVTGNSFSKTPDLPTEFFRLVSP